MRGATYAAIVRIDDEMKWLLKAIMAWFALTRMVSAPRAAAVIEYPQNSVTPGKPI
jgi:hypothetical protein